MNTTAQAFEPPAHPAPADLDDFEQYIAHQLRGWADEERADLEAYLRRFPGHSVADWKAKGPTGPLDAEPYEPIWSKLEAAVVREVGTRTVARDLPRNYRQAAARDPGLIWNPLARKYRLRLPSDPFPHLKVPNGP
jgi:hypothetical protein